MIVFLTNVAQGLGVSPSGDPVATVLSAVTNLVLRGASYQPHHTAERYCHYHPRGRIRSRRRPHYVSDRGNSVVDMAWSLESIYGSLVNALITFNIVGQVAGDATFDDVTKVYTTPRRI